MHFFNQLPEEIIDCIIEDLSDDSLYCQQDLIPFYVVNKSLYSVKRRRFGYALNSRHSLSLLSNERFREQVLERLVDPSKQLFLTLVDVPETSLPFSGYFLSVNTLKLYDCHNVVDITNQLRLSISHTLILMKCGSIDRLDGFSHLQKVIISNNDRIEDVSPLKEVPYVMLFCCSSVINYDELGGNHEFLDLSFTYQITSVISFMTVYTLKLCGCTSIEDFGVFRNATVYELHLSGCLISDVSVFTSVRVLKLVACRRITSVKSLPLSVTNLDISYNDSINDVACLTHLKVLRIVECPEIAIVSPLRQLHKLYISVLHDLSDLNELISYNNRINVILEEF
jgi:hypothetical protein